MIGSGGNLTRLEYGNVVNDQSRCRIVSDDIGPRHDRETHAEVDVTGRPPSMNNDSIRRHSLIRRLHGTPFRRVRGAYPSERRHYHYQLTTRSLLLLLRFIISLPFNTHLKGSWWCW